MSEYTRATKPEGFAPSDHPEWLGRLFLVFPLSVERVEFTRRDGTPDPTDIVTCDIVILDLPDQTGQPTCLGGARIGGVKMAPTLKRAYQASSNPKALGRLKQEPRQGDKSGAFYLEAPPETDPQWVQDCNTARQYEATHPRGYSAPAASIPPPAPSYAPAASAAAAPAWGPNGGAATAPATGAAQPAPAWGVPNTAPAAPPWPDGLADYLTKHNVSTDRPLDEALQIAQQIQAQNG